MLIPTPLSTLNPAFLETFGEPAGLWLPCDGPEAKAYDFSYNGNTGTLNGGITTSGDGVGVLGQSWKFDGTSSAPVSVSSGIWDLSKPWSIVDVEYHIGAQNFPSPISIGIKPGTTYGVRLDKVSSTWPNKFRVLISTSALSNQTITSTDNFNQNAWYVRVVTHDGSGNLKQFVNGASEGNLSITGTLPTNANYINLGGNLPWSGSAMVGSVGIAMFTYQQLTAGQVSDLYSSLLYGEPYRIFTSNIIEQLSLYASVSHGTIYNKSLSDIITLSENIIDNKVKVLSLIDSILFTDAAVGLDPKIVRILLSYKNILLGGGISDEF